MNIIRWRSQFYVRQTSNANRWPATLRKISSVILLLAPGSLTLKTPVQKGVLIEFVFGTSAFRDGYVQIGSFKNDDPDSSDIHITVPVDWVNVEYTNPNSVKDFVQKMATGFVEIFNNGKVDIRKERFRYYLMNEDDDTAITLGYFSEEEKGTTFKGTDSLIIEEFLEFQNAQDKIAEFYKDTLWFTPIAENCNTFRDVVQIVRENFSKNGRFDYSGVEIIKINSAFNNFLASITSYLNHMEKKLKNRNEKYWEKFHKHTSEHYDQNISYRFLYALRNYIQHQAPPIHITYKSDLVDKKPIHHIDIFCSKEELLKNEKWNKTQRNDILNMDDIIDVSVHVDSMMESLNQILISHIQDEFSYLRESAEFIHNLLQLIPEGKNKGVYEINVVNRKIVGMVPHLMYADIVEAIIENNIYKILRPN